MEGSKRHLASGAGVERADGHVARCGVAARGERRERREHAGAGDDARDGLLAEGGAVVDDESGVPLRDPRIWTQELHETLEEDVGLGDFVAVQRVLESNGAEGAQGLVAGVTGVIAVQECSKGGNSAVATHLYLVQRGVAVR